MLKGTRKKLGDILLDAEVISDEQLKKGLEIQEQKGIQLGKALIQLGYTTQEDIIKALSEQLGIPFISLENYQIDESVLSLIPENLAREYKILPLFKIGNTLNVGMVDPLDVFTIDEISRKTNLEVEPSICTEEELIITIDHYYGSTSSLDEAVQIIQEDEGIVDEEIDEEIILKEGDDAPIIKFVNLVFSQAVKNRASDIHVEPEEDKLLIRFRIDGVLHQIHSQPKKLQNAIISRLKIMAELDIAERRLPQDGRFQIKIDNRDIDVRVSTIPTINGENIVMRLLDKTNILVKLEELGFTKKTLEEYKSLLDKPYGILLVTGPTGSGKTTTLYASLNSIISEEKNIVTVEDPIEYRLKLIRQSQINPKIGLTFAAGLRALLRQDPDIMMVGEIRDTETAKVAVQSALTGHLVLSTLHTNDAPGAITRLLDMKVEPFLVSASTIGILAQRLIRTICPKCKESYEPTETVLKDLKISTNNRKFTFYKGKGCRDCRETGYKGRKGIFELLTIDNNIRDLIMERTSLAEIKTYAYKKGMKTLRQDGILKVIKGLTTIEEIMKATSLD